MINSDAQANTVKATPIYTYCLRESSTIGYDHNGHSHPPEPSPEALGRKLAMSYYAQGLHVRGIVLEVYSCAHDLSRPLRQQHHPDLPIFLLDANGAHHFEPTNALDVRSDISRRMFEAARSLANVVRN